MWPSREGDIPFCAECSFLWFSSNMLSRKYTNWFMIVNPHIFC